MNWEKPARIVPPIAVNVAEAKQDHAVKSNWLRVARPIQIVTTAFVPSTYSAATPNGMSYARRRP